MIAAAVLSRRVPYALVLALALLGGTLGGGAAYESSHPPFHRIVWLDRDAAGGDVGDPVVRRALFADGRFVVLTLDGYRAGLVDAGLAAELFATARGSIDGWDAAYSAAGPVGQLVELEFTGAATRRIRIANPEMNLNVPAALSRVVRLLAAADRSVETVAFAPSSLLITAVESDTPSDVSPEPVPVGFPLVEAATTAEGIVIGGGDLAVLSSIWTDLASRFELGLNHRFVAADGQVWRVSWRLDLDGLGALPQGAAAQ